MPWPPAAGGIISQQNGDVLSKNFDWKNRYDIYDNGTIIKRGNTGRKKVRGD
jgi:hypothetical protein